MSEQALFPLSAPSEELRVTLRVRREGRAYELVHCFREPSAADRKAFWEQVTRPAVLEARPGEPRADYLGANQLLYDRCILGIEGYGLPPEAAAGDWRELIPLEHKLWAVERLLERAGVPDEGAVKN